MQRNIRVTYLVPDNNRRMGDCSGKVWKENKRASQIEEQIWYHLLANFNKHILREILEWCHVFHVEKEKKRTVSDKINSEIPVRLKKNVIYTPQLFPDLGLYYYKME